MSEQTTGNAPAAVNPAPQATQPKATTSRNDDWIGCLLLILLIGGIAAYQYLDSKFFAGLRPYNLFLFLVQLAGMGISLICFIMVLIKMFQCEKDRALGIVAGLLTPFFGLGTLIAFGWLVKEALREDHATKDNAAMSQKILLWWGGCLLAQVVVVGYILCNLPTQPAVHAVLPMR